MTIEEIKLYAKEQYGKELTDEEAAKLAAAAQAEGELSEADLEGVSGGAYIRREAVLDDTTAESLPYVQKQEEKKKKVLGLL